MRKLGCFMLVLCLLLGCVPVSATETEPSFFFELTADGEEILEVAYGNIITVTLRLHRTDSDTPYTMYAMQSELCYDSTFLELVEGSAVMTEGVVTTDIAMVDQYREFYMNYLSMSGGTQWNDTMRIGSVQFRVIGTSGVTRITNRDYLVSGQNGTQSLPATANSVTLILTTDCIIRFATSGGSKIDDMTVQYGEQIPRPADPVREGYLFEGWYRDIDKTDPWDFEKDVVQQNMMLYAKWVMDNTPVTAPGDGDACSPCWLWLLLLLILVYMLWRKYRKYRKEKRQENQ